MQSYFLFVRENARWLLGGFLLTMFSSFGQTFFISLSTGQIRQAFDLSSGEYGSIYMVATLASAITLTFLGRIVDRFSIVSTAAFSIISLVFACLLLSQAQSVLALVVALYGLRLFGQGMMSHIAVTAMGRWYAANRGKAVSIVTIGFNAGLAIFPAVFIYFVGVNGWRDIWIAGAIILFVFALPAVVFLFKIERNSIGNSNEANLGREGTPSWTLRQMLQDPVFWLSAMFLLGPPFISTGIFFHQDFLFAERGWSLNLFAWTFVMMTGVSVVSGLVSGILNDRWSAAKLLPLFLVPLGVGCTILGTVEGPIALIIYMVCLGVSMGVNATIYGAIWPEVYGIRHLGAIRSLVTAFMVFSSALGPGVMGWAIDLGVPISTQFIAMTVFCAIGTLILIFCSRQYGSRLVIV